MSTEQFLDIDPLQLDKECLKQPTLYFSYSKKLADARLEADQAKTAMDLTSADLSRKIREKPAKYGLGDKVTEGAINAAIPLQESYRIAQEEYARARHKVDITQAAVTALEHRKRALTLLVELHRQQYFAEPAVSREGREAVGKSTKDRVRRMGQRKVAEDEDIEETE